jgi:hypothetical protein
MAILDFELNDFANPLKMIKPESQNMGNPVINPVIPMAAGLLFSPVFERIYLAILKVPPVLSRVIPIIAPRIIKNPIEAIVFPNPSLIVPIILSGGKVANANISDTEKSAINAVSLNLEVKRIITTMLITTSAEIIRIGINQKIKICLKIRQ